MRKSATKLWLALVCCLCLPGCQDQGAGQGAADAQNGEGKAADQKALIGRVDQHGDEALAGNHKAEAREWLKADSHVVFKADRKQLAQFVEDFYAAGAKQVYFVDLEEHEGKQFADAVLVVLPEDPAARAKLFKVNDRASPVYQEDEVTDQGQKYLYYGLE